VAEEKDGKKPAVEVAVRDRRLREGDVLALSTPEFAEVAHGMHRATFRLRMQGLPRSLGNAVRLEVLDRPWEPTVRPINSRVVYPVDFAEEDAAQDFTVDFDVALPLFLRHRFVSAAEVGEFLKKLPFNNQEKGVLERHGEYIAAQLVAKPCVALNAPEGISEAEKAVFDRLNLWGGVNPKRIKASVTLAENKPGVDGSRGNATPFPSLRRLFVESVGVEAVAQPEFVVRSTDVQYAWRRPGERQVITVEVGRGRSSGVQEFGSSECQGSVLFVGGGE